MIAGVNSKLCVQFFNYGGIEKILGPKYASFKFVPLFGGSHHSILYEPEIFVNDVKEHLLN